jgi:hypothetical protein
LLGGKDLAGRFALVVVTEGAVGVRSKVPSVSQVPSVSGAVGVTGAVGVRSSFSRNPI